MLFSLLALAAIPRVLAVDNGLGLTPQMGWNTWNKFGCDISEETILSTAHSLVEQGLDKLGYKYVIIDDCVFIQASWIP